ncbi:hypothetical protein DFH09DRAFT_1104664 [Mycena vulgaris]|nr:hypothetical protein DFH09DRAFT_1104664 [Mycena vulgaris]
MSALTPLFQPCGACTQCDCSGFLGPRNEIIPTAATQLCLCIHPLHSHQTSEAEQATITALRNTAWAMGGLAATGCAKFFSPDPAWNSQTICLCGRGVMAHERMQHPAAAARTGLSTSTPDAARRPFANTVVTTPLTPVEASPIRSNPVAIFARTLPHTGTLPEQRQFSIMNKLTPETSRPETNALRGKKAKGKGKAKPSPSPFHSGFAPAPVIDAPTSPDRSPPGHPSPAFVLAFEHFQLLLRRCDDMGLFLHIDIPLDGDTDVFVHLNNRITNFFRTSANTLLSNPRHAANDFEHAAWRIIAPARGLGKNAALARVFSPQSIPAYSFTTRTLLGIAARYQNPIHARPLLFLAPTQANISGPIEPDGPRHNCFPWVALAHTALVDPADIPSCTELRCVPSHPPPPKREALRPASLDAIDDEDEDEGSPARKPRATAGAATRKRRHHDLTSDEEDEAPHPTAPPAMRKKEIRDLTSDDEDDDPPSVAELLQTTSPGYTPFPSRPSTWDLNPAGSSPFLSPVPPIAPRPSRPAVSASQPPTRLEAISISSSDSDDEEVDVLDQDSPTHGILMRRAVAQRPPPFRVEQHTVPPPPPADVPRTSAAVIRAFINVLYEPSGLANQTSLSGPTCKIVASDLIMHLQNHSPFLGAHPNTPGATTGTVTIADMLHLHSKHLWVIIGRGSRSGPTRALFSACLTLLIEDTSAWRMRGSYFVPFFNPPTAIFPARLAIFWTAGRIAALSLIHRQGVAPDPISPFFLIITILGPPAFDILTWDFIHEFDPAAASDLWPWFAVDHTSVIPADTVASSPLGQLLVRAGFSQLYVLTRPRTVQEHQGIGHAILGTVLLDLQAVEHHPEIAAFREGFRGPPRPDSADGRINFDLVDSFNFLAPAEFLAHLATMYFCRVTSVDQITSRIVYVMPTRSSHGPSLILAKLFRLRFERWLRGTGHPTLSRQAVGEEDFEGHMQDPLLRARMFMNALTGSQTMGSGADFRFEIHLRETGHPDVNPPYFRTCLKRLDIRLDQNIANALLEWCKLENPADETLFDEYIHKIFLAADAYDRI